MDESQQISSSFLQGTKLHLVVEHVTDALECTISSCTPQANAASVSDSKSKLSYTELNAYANRLARAIAETCVDARDASEQPIIALDVSPSVDLVALQLASWKLGAAELSLDNDIPKDRLHSIFSLVRPTLVVSDSRSDSLLEQQRLPESSKTLRLSDLMLVEKPESDLSVSEILFQHSSSSTAAILFTSGSTGSPKGIRVSHHNLTNRLVWQREEWPCDKDEICLSRTSVTFIDSLTETMGPIFQLVSVVVAPKGISKEADSLHDMLAKQNITRIMMVPSLLFPLLRTWKSVSPPEKLKHVVLGGEVVPLSLIREFRETMGQDAKLFNIYGSTELTGDVTWEQLAGKGSLPFSELVLQNCVSIGRPLTNTTVYILADDNSLQPAGQAGEIFVAGSTLASFVTVPGADYSSRYIFLDCPRTGEQIKCYRTGDRGFIRGTRLYYLGRNDSEIKRRGVRINLCEIEGVVNSIVAVEKVVVLFHEQLQEIFAFIKMSPTNFFDEIAKHVRERIPPYMLPVLITVKDFPLMKDTGKVNRTALLQKGQEDFYQSKWNEKPEALRDSARPLQDLVACVQQVLHTNMIPSFDLSLQEIGIDSISIALLQERLRLMGHQVSARQLIQACSLNSLADTIERGVFQNAIQPTGQVVDLNQYSDIEGLKKQFAEYYYNRCQWCNWLEATSRKKFESWVNSFIDASCGESPCHSFVLVGDDGEMLGCNIVVAEELEGVVIDDVYRVFLHLLGLGMKEVQVELKNQGLTYLEDLRVVVNPSLPTLRQFEVLKTLDKEVQRRAKEGGFDAVVTNNVSPVTRVLAVEEGYELKKKVFIKNTEFDGRRYFTSSDVPDDFYFAAFVKYL